MHVTLVHVHVVAERVDDFIQASRANHEHSVQEDGCLRFDVLQDPADATRFILYEAYKSPEDAAAHKQTKHYELWRDTVAEWMTQPRRGEPMLGLCPCLSKDEE
ncbi:MAG: antibiotic biosynthesis monooxygenase [Gammaproteobacteria bacterium]|nr:antibiotic biosynthesis monooxygenase [Gammaproteobacteria bacterium]MCP5138002.1 antibiotic biosynthesis monooxygenase [Gammaproteobacteria bacterium]